MHADGFRRFTAEEIRLRRSIVAGLYAENKTPEQIAAELSLPIAQVTKDLGYILEALASYYGSLPPEHTFVRYALFQTRLIRNMQEAADAFLRDPEAKQFNTYMTSMRAQSDLMDKILEKGIDFGVIKRKKANELVGKSNKVVIREVQREVMALQDVLKDVGGGLVVMDEGSGMPKLLPASSKPIDAEFSKVDEPTLVNGSSKRRTPPRRSRKRQTTRLVRMVVRRGNEVVRQVQDWKYRSAGLTRPSYSPRAAQGKVPSPSQATQRPFASEEQTEKELEEELAYLRAEVAEASAKRRAAKAQEQARAGSRPWWARKPR